MFSSGQAATTTTLLGLLQCGRRGDLQLRRSTAARCTCSPTCCRSSASGRGSCRSSELAQHPERALGQRPGWSGSSRRSTRRCAASTSRRVAAACRARGVLSVIDNTFASPINQQPLALGVDLVMHSATKYLNGHSDVTAGALAGPARLMAPIEKARRLIGGGARSRTPAYALGRGLKTLDVRVARHNANAHGGGRVARAGPPRRPGLLPGPGVASRPRAGARGRCRDSAAWCAWTSAAASSAPRGSSIGSA